MKAEEFTIQTYQWSCAASKIPKKPTTISDCVINICFCISILTSLIGQCYPLQRYVGLLCLIWRIVHRLSSLSLYAKTCNLCIHSTLSYAFEIKYIDLESYHDAATKPGHTWPPTRTLTLTVPYVCSGSSFQFGCVVIGDVVRMGLTEPKNALNSLYHGTPLSHNNQLQKLEPLTGCSKWAEKLRVTNEAQDAALIQL